MNWSLCEQQVVPINGAYRNMDWKTYLQRTRGKVARSKAVHAAAQYAADAKLYVAGDAATQGATSIRSYEFEDSFTAVGRARAARARGAR